MAARQRACAVASWHSRRRDAHLMKYRVPYRTDAWQPRVPRFPVTGRVIAECQVVEQDLGNQRRLYVELLRYAGQPIRVTVARVESTTVYRCGARRRRNLAYLQPDDLDVVEVAVEDQGA